MINLVTGDDRAVSKVALADPELAGLHFTGSTATFKLLWRTVADHLDGYRGYPRLVGETGGKDVALAHPCADPAALKTALVRGALHTSLPRAFSATPPRTEWLGHRFPQDEPVDAVVLGLLDEPVSGGPGPNRQVLGLLRVAGRHFDELTGPQPGLSDRPGRLRRCSRPLATTIIHSIWR